MTPEEFGDTVSNLEDAIGAAIVGQREVVRELVVALVAGGHVLLEGVPGLGKTMMVRTLAAALDLSFARIQFTPDLMPADITGTNILQETSTGSRAFSFQQGPIFANLVLADEINRATPKTQSALLESMQEGTATIANVMHRLPDPFFVLATQNPIEMEGTYPLPEAQLDRFLFKLLIPYPSADDLARIVTMTSSNSEPTVPVVASASTIREMGHLARQVNVAGFVTDYIVRLTLATHAGSERSTEATRRFVRFGVSPRGAQALMMGAKIHALLDGRANVSYGDVKRTAHSALRHRLILNFEADAAGVSADDVLAEILAAVPTEAF